MEYRILDTLTYGKYAGVTILRNFDNYHKINSGESWASVWSGDAYYEMDKEFPKQKKLPDSLKNRGSAFVVSTKLRSFLETIKGIKCEFLSVKILNHDNEEIEQEYSICNILEIIDCIDKEKSNIVWNSIDTTLISGCYQLVVADKSLDSNPPLFRIKHKPSVLVVREDIAEALENFTGIDVDECLEDYCG